MSDLPTAIRVCKISTLMTDEFFPYKWLTAILLSGDEPVLW